jgi:hypothetical protein
MYYQANFLRLGEKKAIVYANKYINNLQLGCNYVDQKQVNNFCPDIVKNNFIVPDFFKNMIKNID